MAESPLHVVFTFAEGDVWIDPNDVAWYVDFTVSGAVYFKRTLTTAEDPVEVARTWRKLESGEPRV